MSHTPTPILDALDSYFRGEQTYEATLAALERLHCAQYVIDGFREVAQAHQDSYRP